MLGRKRAPFLDGDALDSIRVVKRCPVSWNGMEGNDQIRFCSKCSRHVYNLSDMTRAEALEYIDRVEGRMCVRFHVRSDGKVMTRDCGWAVKARWKARSACAAFFGVFGLFILTPQATMGARISPQGDFRRQRHMLIEINESLRDEKDPSSRQALLEMKAKCLARLKADADEIGNKTPYLP